MSKERPGGGKERETQRERERERERERRGAFRPFYNSIEFVDYIIQNQTLLS